MLVLKNINTLCIQMQCRDEEISIVSIINCVNRIISWTILLSYKYYNMVYKYLLIKSYNIGTR